MAVLVVEFGVVGVGDFEDAVFDAEGVEGVCAEGVFGEFGGPAGEVFAVEEGKPAVVFCGVGEGGGEQNGEGGEGVEAG